MSGFDKKLEGTAYHEAGHAVITRHLGYPVHSVTIKPGDDYQGAALSDDPTYGRRLDLDNAESGTDDKMKHRVISALAGSVAEHRFSPEGFDLEGSSDDYKVVYDLVLSLGGGGDDVGEELYQKTRALVSDYWSDIDRVARALLDRTELSGDDLERTLE